MPGKAQRCKARRGIKQLFLIFYKVWRVSVIHSSVQSGEAQSGQERQGNARRNYVAIILIFLRGKVGPGNVTFGDAQFSPARFSKANIPKENKMLQQSAVKITIRGLSPLLQNNPISMLKSNDDNAKVRRVKVSPEVEAESTTYRDSNGALFIPSSAIFGCILNGASDLKVKGTRKSGASILKGSILGITDITGTQRQVTIRDENGNPKVDIEIYSARCVIQRASVIKHRAMIDNWTMEFIVRYASEYIASSSLIIDALERGGILVGIGDYRPEKKGEFGRFEVVSHQEL